MTVPRSAAPSTRPRADLSTAAFEELYRGSRDDVFGYLAGVLRDRHAAEEVTAQAFERAWRRRRQLDPDKGTPRAWLFGIARNAALDELRRRSRLASLDAERAEQAEGAEAAWMAAGGRSDGGDPAEPAMNRADLQRALRSLDGRERDLVALKFFAGLSNGEIARVIGVSESNAGTKLHRTIQKLRRSLDETA